MTQKTIRNLKNLVKYRAVFSSFEDDLSAWVLEIKMKYSKYGIELNFINFKNI